jgi:hypothetical protein
MFKGNLEVVELHVCLWDIQFDHSNDVYQMLNLESKRIIHSRDVISLEINVIIGQDQRRLLKSLMLMMMKMILWQNLQETIAINSDISSNQQPARSERSKERLYIVD